MNVQGKIHMIMDIQQVTDTFRKREFVLEYSENPMYPQFILFQMVQDRCDLISGFNPGDMVDVTFNLRGRQWNSPQGETKFFNSLEAWGINPMQEQQPANTPPPVAQQMQQPAATANTAATPQVVDVTQMDDDDDLPF